MTIVVDELIVLEQSRISAACFTDPVGTIEQLEGDLSRGERGVTVCSRRVSGGLAGHIASSDLARGSVWLGRVD